MKKTLGRLNKITLNQSFLIDGAEINTLIRYG